jgi:hypothetical protein
MKDKILALVISVICIVAFTGIGKADDEQIDYEGIIQEGFSIHQKLISKKPAEGLEDYANWLQRHPQVRFAKLVSNDISIIFANGYSIILLDFDQDEAPQGRGFPEGSYPVLIKPTQKTAIITDALEWQGWSPAEIVNPIIQDLQDAGYNVKYVKNEEVDVKFIEQNHNKGVIYHRGHGGVIADEGGNETIVIETGQHWIDTNNDEKPDGYEYEFDQGWVTRVGVRHGFFRIYYFVGYLPGLIEHYCSDLPSSLVYMTSCDGTYNPTMANAYLGAGAKAYVGWNKPVTVNHGNKWAKEDFHMFCVNGYSVQQVIANTPQDNSTDANLTYYGDSSLTLT